MYSEFIFVHTVKINMDENKHNFILHDALVCGVRMMVEIRKYATRFRVSSNSLLGCIFFAFRCVSSEF